MSPWFGARRRTGDNTPTGRLPRTTTPSGRDTAVDAGASGEGTGPVAVPAAGDGGSVASGAGVPAAPPVDHEQALTDRHTLIQLCLYALDRARSAGVVERLEQGLAGIGVHAVRPDGQRFDPAVHEAGGAVPTDDTALAGTVAETEVVGFVDQGRLLRAPVVTVYTRR
ncbi:nucleotide exchange factor GrpE [Saccharomonospora iraqiensis]|uniref:nucleotide exchange factor GrpE n=1 Tax=Saccharomonospora iraqiensis TaxID=52698 RepID=UPI00022E004F|nr:nucleotide exchange factor GrpE [Saccharomonospora iraqiensis]